MPLGFIPDRLCSATGRTFEDLINRNHYTGFAERLYLAYGGKNLVRLVESAATLAAVHCKSLNL